MTTTDGATVFVIDDDDLVRAAIQGMLKSVGLKAERSRRRKSSSAQADGRAELPYSRRGASGGERSGFSTAVGCLPAFAFPSSSSPVMEIFR